MPPSPLIPARARSWLLLVYWALMFLMTHLPGIDRWEPPGGWFIKDPDKYVHFFAFAGWVLVWTWMLHSHARRLTRTAALYLLLGGAAYAAFDEITQGVVGRTPDFEDWILDVCGLAFGLLLAGLYESRRAARSLL